MRSSWARIAFATLLAAATLSLPGSQSAAFATVNCDIDGPHFFAGGDTTYQSAIYGASGVIDTFTPNPCGSGAASAWVLVTAPNEAHPGSLNHLAQAGYGYWTANSTSIIAPGFHAFAEFSRACYPFCPNDPEGHIAVIDPAPTAGTVKYDVYLEASTQKVAMAYGGNVLTRTGYVVSNFWESEWQAQFEAETFQIESNIVGTQFDQVRFFNLRKYDSSGNTSFVQSFGGGSGVSCPSACSRYHYNPFVPGGGSLGFKTGTWSN